MTTNKSNSNNSEILLEMDQAISNSGLPMNEINKLLKVVEERVRCDSECQRKRDIKELKKKWETSEKDYKNLPEEIKVNERNYYTMYKGEEYYRNNILKNKYQEYILDWKEDQLNKFHDVKSLITTTFDNYKSQNISKSRINELYQDVLQKNTALKNDIDDYYKKTFTNERRVYYENNEIDNLQFYTTILKVLYYGLLIIYILFGSFFKNKDYKNWKILLIIILYIFFPFSIMVLIKSSLNIYNGL